MKTLFLNKDLTLQEPIPDEGIEKAIEVLRSGRLHRYNSSDDNLSDVALFEQEFATWAGKKYALACTSCGTSIAIALEAAGVKPGDMILCNSYTLAPVPGAMHKVGALPVFVEIGEDHTIDLEDLENKARLGISRFLLLSHMRGHSADMDAIVDICNRYNLTLIEDSAHTLGAKWNGKLSGTFGTVGCYSTQTYKHLNSGEGGILVTDDPHLIARAIIHSGSYMLYDKHLSRPDNDIFESVKLITANYSCRMDNLRAAILRPQLRVIDKKIEQWNLRYKIVEEGLRQIEGLTCPTRPNKEEYVGSSIQFNLPHQSATTIQAFLQAAKKMGLEIKWFGNKVPCGFTSVYSSWQYLRTIPQLPKSDLILSTLCDIRIPLTLTLEDCQLMVAIINQAALETLPTNSNI